MTDLILFLLAATGLFNGLTNLVMVRAVRKHLKAHHRLSYADCQPSETQTEGRRMNGAQFVIMLKDGRYWIGQDGPVAQTTGHIDAATKYSSRWVALGEMNRAGAIMHLAAIVELQAPQ